MNRTDSIARHEDVPFTRLSAEGRARRAAQARAASTRRRNVDPATCDRDYSSAEIEFMKAMQEYKQRSGQTYPTWGAILGIVRGLGYQK